MLGILKGVMVNLVAAKALEGGEELSILERERGSSGWCWGVGYGKI